MGWPIFISSRREPKERSMAYMQKLSMSMQKAMRKPDMKYWFLRFMMFMRGDERR